MQVDVSAESGDVTLTITPSNAAENALLQVAQYRDKVSTESNPVTGDEHKFEALVISFTD